MVTSQHEASHRIFQEQPELLRPVFRILGVPLPERPSVEVITPDVTETRLLERRIDTLLRINEPDGDGFLLAIEDQRRRDPDKAASWGYYLSYLHSKYSIPALLLVVCQDKTTSDWAKGPFRMGLSDWTALSVQPMVVGPDNVPMITDPDEAAQDLAFAAFSAVTHGRSPGGKAVLETLVTALGSTGDRETFDRYWQLVDAGLGEIPARTAWRDLIKMAADIYYPGQGTLAEEKYLEGEAKGKAEGKAEALLIFLEQRQVPIPNNARFRISACTDLHTLDHWLTRSLTAAHADDLFADAPEHGEA
ncbi:hypothetical protein [Streptomyces sp. Je 1-369]|uniref:hypothetical protein n=1 Tax=Streptomyces sp. Je 1-369 TaxID=2966192 RepID=UPI00228615C5|nr:hypothetical protein [Streptomyces sp. Je 1-369]WAL96715.1 hypothetical protein NOO62_20845 [Streptomyces sp. Je 1-369]